MASLWRAPRFPGFRSIAMGAAVVVAEGLARRESMIRVVSVGARPSR